MEKGEVALAFCEGFALLCGGDFVGGKACSALEHEDAVEESPLFVAEASDELLRAEERERRVVAVLEICKRAWRGQGGSSRASEGGEEGKITESAIRSLSHPAPTLPLLRASDEGLTSTASVNFLFSSLYLCAETPRASFSSLAWRSC